MLIVAYTGEVSSDDIRFYVTSFTPSSAVVGTALKALVQDGTLFKSAVKKTDLKSSHGRGISVYKMVK